MLVNVERLQTQMDDQSLDGLVVTTLPNLQYLAGFWSLAIATFPYTGQCYAVITRDEPTKPIVVSSSVEIDQVLDGFPVSGAVRFGTFYREGPFDEANLTEEEHLLKAISMDSPSAGTPIEALATALKQAGLSDKRVGVDELGLRDGYLEQLKTVSPRADLCPASDLMYSVRLIKTDEEIQRLRAAARVAEQAILAASAIAREGITEYELAREFERSVVSQGGYPQLTLIRIGRNAVAGQRQQDRTPLRGGDTIWFDVVLRYQGYWADVARIFSLGEPSEHARVTYSAMLAGEEAGLREAQAGMTGSELFDIVIDAVRGNGCPHYRRHHVGHGIGAEVYEKPMLAPHEKTAFEPGMVLNIETPYYEFGLGALHVEDPFVIGPDGQNELLTTLGRELHVIEPCG